VANWLGLDAILLVPGGVGADFIPGFPVTPYDVAYCNLVAALKGLAPTAERLGVTIGVENVWNKFLLSPLEMRALLDTVSSKKVASYFDVGNVLQFGYPEQWIRILGPRIKRVHFKDFNRTIGNLSGFCPIGEGDVDWPAVMAAFAQVGYDGYVTAEIFDAEADLERTASAMKAILQG
jgi:hexulose-6-phosphate isomerase